MKYCSSLFASLILALCSSESFAGTIVPGKLRCQLIVADETDPTKYIPLSEEVKEIDYNIVSVAEHPGGQTQVTYHLLSHMSYRSISAFIADGGGNVSHTIQYTPEGTEPSVTLSSNSFRTGPTDINRYFLSSTTYRDGATLLRVILTCSGAVIKVIEE